MMKIRKVVYVIDDDESVRKSFARLLRSEKLECETFSSPEEFLNVFKTGKKCLYYCRYSNARVNRF